MNVYIYMHTHVYIYIYMCVCVYIYIIHNRKLQRDTGLDCQQSCDNDQTGECNYFTWHQTGFYARLCFHYTECHDVDVNCHHCYSGLLPPTSL